ncbi:hypothetical protein LZ318_31980 [Saccharopolyspora indica]|uniref:hypothetical protein n=1 Tax=Saccharopolyspora indica TaxID=1229659 RepID=UPI0022EB5521|nr:hypothetical protein [Saccharopolyspora indica]MDA3644142.1 hypothetical protein [Saccharopolyspora indica]
MRLAARWMTLGAAELAARARTALITEAATAGSMRRVWKTVWSMPRSSSSF